MNPDRIRARSGLSVSMTWAAAATTGPGAWQQGARVSAATRPAAVARVPGPPGLGNGAEEWAVPS